MKKAIYFMLLSAVSFTAMNLFVKYLAHFGGAQLVFFRAFGSLFFTMSYLLWHKIPILGNQKGLLIYRGLAGVTSMGLFFMSVNYLPIGSAVSLRYLSPIFATIFAILFLREQVKPIQWLFFLMAFSGVLMIKGFDPNIDSFGLLLVLGSAVFSGIVYVLINKIGHRDHPVVIVNYFMWISVTVGGILSIFNWTTPKGIEWPLLLSLGVFGYFGQLFMTKAFQSQATNKVVSLKYVEVIFTMIAGTFWFADIYPALSIIGTLLVITGLILNIWYRQR
ncbi:drug/metabolite transporter (DMT)-like permease [Aquimarina sp. EL_43]|uniref:DMT family transporter n=1 Tax=Aquimarina TaxID=290174 RepID=UPI001A1BCC39|nr:MULTISPECIES: DMT family transporter [Aquimarina]MBG6129378.1 drug/metabolite transporter (DMT)-like permease [Aquimarina sp. EL_35]MBG6150443.1 drug/metabolite transporter (DMT)-like permease [Aquimarina sp. EL_32]MBG6168249.1 drug/metabolite transporter (DMT)-like permease [Aquimarina sp. EL_43]